MMDSVTLNLLVFVQIYCDINIMPAYLVLCLLYLTAIASWKQLQLGYTLEGIVDIAIILDILIYV